MVSQIGLSAKRNGALNRAATQNVWAVTQISLAPFSSDFRQITLKIAKPSPAIDASTIQRELGWAPEETFETGIRKTVEWYLSNTVWVEHVKSGSYQQWIDQNYADRSNKA